MKKNKILKKCGAVAKKAFTPRNVALVSFCFILGASAAYADGVSAFNQAEVTIRSYQEPVKKICEAIALVICIVGAFNVYFKMQNGDQDVKKTVMLTLGGCIAFVALAQALPSFFGGS